MWRRVGRSRSGRSRVRLQASGRVEAGRQVKAGKKGSGPKLPASAAAFGLSVQLVWPAMSWWGWSSWSWSQSDDWDWQQNRWWWEGYQAALDERAAWLWQEEEDRRTAQWYQEEEDRKWWQEEEGSKAALAERALQEGVIGRVPPEVIGGGTGSKKKKRNNKGRVAGSGTVSNARRLEFQKKGLQRRLEREEAERKAQEEAEEEEGDDDGDDDDKKEKKKVTLVERAARQAREFGPSEKQNEKEAAVLGSGDVDRSSSSSSSLLDTTLDKREKKKAKTPDEAASERAEELKAALAERAPAAFSKSPRGSVALAVKTKKEEEEAALAERAARRQKKFQESKTGLYLDDEEEKEEDKVKEEKESPPGSVTVDSVTSASVPDHASMEASSAARSRGHGESLGKGPQTWQVKFPAALGKRVAIDFHHVLEVEGACWSRVPTENISAVQALRESGYWVCLLSYSGRDREAETRRTLKALEEQHGLVFDDKRFVRAHLGKRGKAQLCKTLAITDLFDDRDDILWEASTLGITDWAIRKARQHHYGHARAYNTLADAVEAFLESKQDK